VCSTMMMMRQSSLCAKVDDETVASRCFNNVHPPVHAHESERQTALCPLDDHVHVRSHHVLPRTQATEVVAEEGNWIKMNMARMNDHPLQRQRHMPILQQQVWL